MAAYYNENDAFAAEWLRRLIASGLLPAGHVDERSVADVRASDLDGFDQCHFFAGIGGWPRALSLAGFPATRPVWTGSPPCQPFSHAGLQKGSRDDRHLWPHWARLIGERRPRLIFGEQVASALSHGWFDGVADDLETQGYAVGAVCLPACAVGAPHIRQRLWFVADAESARRAGGLRQDGTLDDRAFARNGGEVDTDADGGRREGVGLAQHDDLELPFGDELDGLRAPGRRNGAAMADADAIRRAGRKRPDETGQANATRRSGEALADADEPGLSPSERGVLRGTRRRQEGRAAAQCDWWGAEPDMGRVAYGLPCRVGRLRGYGNAIVPQVAAEFVKAYLDARG